jgi:hydroxyethylthiazole kinase
MNNTANALLSIGASPVMAHAIEEVQDMVGFASALVVNIGTLSEKWIDAMESAMKQAKYLKIPIVFDPVGAGATPFRNEACKRLLEIGKPDIIRGNGSEIMALADITVKTKGVDSSADSKSAVDAAKSLSIKTNAVVVISGETDFIVLGNRLEKVSNGDFMMTKVTGMGCTASALCGAFAGVENDLFVAARNAMSIMGIAGEIAVERSNGPASLQMNFIDALFNIGEDDIKSRLK